MGKNGVIEARWEDFLQPARYVKIVMILSVE